MSNVGEMQTIAQVVGGAWDTGMRNMVPTIWGRNPIEGKLVGPLPCPLEVHVRASVTAGWGWTTLNCRYAGSRKPWKDLPGWDCALHLAGWGQQHGED